MRRVVSVCLLAAVLTAAWSADMAVQALDCAQNARARIVSVLVGAKARTPDVVARVSAQVTKWQLYKVDPLTFGFLDGARGDNMVTTTGGSHTVTSPDNPWTAADVGKTIYLQGVGTQISFIAPFDYDPLVTTIASFVSAGEITVTDAPTRGVTANRTSRAGIAMWGDLVPVTLNASPLTSPDGSIIYQKQALDLTALSSATVTPVGATTARTLARHLGDVVNAKNRGAVGDGVTDDTAALQAALDYCANSGTPIKGRLFLPDGTYKITSTLTAGKGVAIIGNGRLTTKILCAAPFTGTYAIKLGTPGGFGFNNFIEELTLDCASIAAFSGVLLDKAQEGCGARSCTISNFTQYGIDLSVNSPANVFITDAWIWGDASGSVCGIYGHDVTNMGIYKTTVVGQGYRTMQAGIRLWDCTGVTMQCIHLESAVDGVHIQGNNGTIVGTGITAGTTAAASVTNLIHSNSAPRHAFYSVVRNSADHTYWDEFTGVTVDDSFMPDTSSQAAIMYPHVAITPTGAPFMYRNMTARPMVVYVVGGTVSTIKTSYRNGDPLTTIGLTSGTFILVPGEALTIDYTVAPTMLGYPL